MDKKNLLLVVDAIVNLLLGILLMVFPTQLLSLVDLPPVKSFFYVNILGAVLFGIGIALLVERYAGKKGFTGLGIAGAIAINLCGAGALILWMLFGNLDLSPGGTIFLWSIAILVFGVAAAELFIKAGSEQT